jgi:hypothetical protein
MAGNNKAGVVIERSFMGNEYTSDKIQLKIRFCS